MPVDSVPAATAAAELSAPLKVQSSGVSGITQGLRQALLRDDAAHDPDLAKAIDERGARSEEGSRKKVTVSQAPALQLLAPAGPAVSREPFRNHSLFRRTSQWVDSLVYMMCNCNRKPLQITPIILSLKYCSWSYG